MGVHTIDAIRRYTGRLVSRLGGLGVLARRKHIRYTVVSSLAMVEADWPGWAAMR